MGKKQNKSRPKEETENNLNSFKQEVETGRLKKDFEEIVCQQTKSFL